jgi:hypothetical protein
MCASFFVCVDLRRSELLDFLPFLVFFASVTPASVLRIESGVHTLLTKCVLVSFGVEEHEDTVDPEGSEVDGGIAKDEDDKSEESDGWAWLPL